MKTRFLTMVLLCLVSCQSENGTHDASHLHDVSAGSPQPSTETLEQTNKRLQDQAREEEKSKTDFSLAHKKYHCAESDVPDVEESSGPGRNYRSMQFGDHLVMKLTLGALLRVNGENSGPMRTKSRYNLFWDGKLVTSAESLFSLSKDVGDENTSSRFIYNPKDQSLLVFDDLCWSTKRHILFERNHDSKWTAKYFCPPSRPIFGSPVSHEGKIRGIGYGKVYIEVDGQVYAIPVDDLVERTLEFTVG